MHTKGPWNLGSSDVPVSSISVHSNTGSKHSTLARVVDGGWMSAVESYDNARLMAAAPELLESLREVVKEAAGWLDDSTGHEPDEYDWYKKASAVIYKATGEPL